jgi:hypothetical protein
MHLTHRSRGTLRRKAARAPELARYGLCVPVRGRFRAFSAQPCGFERDLTYPQFIS